MSLSYLTTQALKGRCFWRREGGKEKTGAAGKKRRKEKPPLSFDECHGCM
ncbi:hypothetical protein POPTR_001G189601v4 [Populus trichocarpa]|uniref:Uncharacterized protein n=1 Tax=Populus trichocarpa TaxID=3694 RepID=A0ACC0TJZ9_POPTR|nr:hypothetical protein BDE02_01G170800 [Populus trichocarpa]KAI9401917.1 hypothetical protein POPTR_001G189601v4 [Populus trichocarpa]